MPLEEELNADMDAALAAKAEDPEFALVDVTIRGKLRTLRFEQMDGLKWAELAAQCPMNPRSPTDRGYGYNLRSMTLLAGPESGTMRNAEGEWETLSATTWTKLYRSLTGIDHRAIANQLFQLNELGPAMAVDAARKVFEADSAKNSSLPARSESPTPD